MKKLMLCLVALAALVTTPALRAQSAASPAAGNLSGNWQGTLKVGKDLRIIFNIYKGEKDGWSAELYSIDQTPQPIPVRVGDSSGFCCNDLGQHDRRLV